MLNSDAINRKRCTIAPLPTPFEENTMAITLHHAQTVPEGDGVTVNRLMPVQGRANFDPFVLWDHFDIGSGGFPDHPHRGFEGITYLFSGGMNHTDNLGNRGRIGAGGVQRFTAGRGIIHSEFPDGRTAGIQLWVNLPQRLKGIAPDYQQLEANDLPQHQHGKSTICTIIGKDSPLQLQSSVCYQDISLCGSYALSIPDGWRGLLYVVEGEATINGSPPCPSATAAFIEHETILSLNSDAGARVMACFGQPHHEPIRQHGSFVD
ncbi:MAG: pirin family protein [Mariprofundales bacterium]|nr:pirin family protein [Mariprofundales bacterium]